ncbi:hypothetical protein OCO53_18225 [Peribacillus frigoritolerans]|uniref:hypothetical protein n=1 Tax=Peribacillus frigoritolerans TaxID=450367 RepID=UPI0021D0DDD3|nr:hypothetical protein [Peribacillus frigoritolerans]MCU6602407.1 hypothetical protein [Peribacillus frigoritolerans]
MACEEVGRTIADSFIINSTMLNSGIKERVASAIRFYLGKNEIPINLLDIISL